jgi:hypothetical protein
MLIFLLLTNYNYIYASDIHMLICMYAYIFILLVSRKMESDLEFFENSFSEIPNT